MRVAAYCHRFITNCHKKDRKGRKWRPLTADEIHKLSTSIIRMVQQQEFANDIKYLQDKHTKISTKFHTLNPFIDADNILRVGGILINADLPFSQTHPISLPSGHHITNLIIRYAHENLAHGGSQMTLTTIRTQYWIIDGKRAVNRVIHKCIKCHKFKVITAQQLMGTLPAPRVTISPPFSNVGVDYLKDVVPNHSKDTFQY